MNETKGALLTVFYELEEERGADFYASVDQLWIQLPSSVCTL